ncbi:hypothetical protein [Sphingomonas sp. Y38-1Y]|uniref:hypothetical protein n=1 Tax=Sphingomonas sp. Y38-1Y TaxID=3078265 RepID=UPI0028E46ADC|nr:hypothetical protein [Sphingomonas sp. Y38-1Y]
MKTIFIGITFSAVIWSIARCASIRFRDEASLPMQWWLDGEVIWSAPRKIALAFIPAISTLLLIGVGVLLSIVQPRPGQEGLATPTCIALGLLVLGAQLFHLWMVDRSVRQNRN